MQKSSMALTAVAASSDARSDANFYVGKNREKHFFLFWSIFNYFTEHLNSV